MPTAVRGAVSRSVGAPQSVEDLELADPGTDEVRVAIEAVAVCHSDLSFVDGDWASAGPTVWGHEATGVVTDIGPSAGDGRTPLPPPGERVVLSLIRWCGRCRSCRRGDEVGCTAAFPLDARSPLIDGNGRPVGQGLRTAAFGEAVLVDRSQVVPIGRDLPVEQAALLGCGVLTGVGAVRRSADVYPGDAVAVVGTGGVGLSVVQGARLVRAHPILAIDPSADRRQRARGLGATHDLDPTEVDVDGLSTAVHDLLGHGVDHAIVATGSAAALEGVVELLAPGGAVTLVGMPPDGTELVVDPVALAAAGQRIVGSKMGSARPAEDVPWLVERVLDGQLDLDPVVGRTFALDEIDSALDALRHGDGVRPIIRFEGVSS